ncbi:MAG: hypothetical protein JJE46_11030 [Acidimicrobiia bacterium]|nr:hypothetical protein [Acidimicrobiia bacterium]
MSEARPQNQSDRAFSSLDRRTLAMLAREWFLHGHLQDRVGIPLLYQYGVDREGAEQVAIDEWAGASPLYSLRMQDTLDFRGSTVDVILKNLQFDIGAPLQYMDFRMTYIDPDHAEFQLDHCGALMDVEPMGDEWVHGMCHTIEDPTFDATAAATNPHAVMRPIHRPPRTPADRMPHCAWTITVDPSGPAAHAHPNLAVVAESLVAGLPTPTVTADPDDDGRTTYADAFDPDLGYDDLSRSALLAILREAAIQSHLLMRSYLVSVTERVGPEVAAEVAPRILVGVAPVTGGRLARALDAGDDPTGIARVLALHPSFQPADYVDARVELVDDHAVRLSFGDSPVFAEIDGLTWLAGIAAPDDRAIDALVRGINPRARAARTEPIGDERLAFSITVDPDAAARVEEPETSLARFSTAATFEFA